MFKAALFDIDGTLVDSNDAHAHAWVQAFEESGHHVQFARVRRCIGMGGDKLMPAVAGIAEESPEGQRISQARSRIFSSTYLPHLRAFRGAAQLVAKIRSRGLKTVAASSAKQDEVEALLKIAGAASLIPQRTSGDDAEESKPEPDIVHAALQQAKADAHETVMIGDTPYDIEAAVRAGVKAIAFRCGGWDDEALQGAMAIYDGPWDLLLKLDESPLSRNP